MKSIIEFYDLASGKVTELKRFDFLMEAPFFASNDKLMYNAEGKIYQIELATGEVSQVDTGFCIRCNNDHVLSPDGTKLAVSHHPEDGQSRVFLVDLTGKEEPKLITPNAPSYLHGYSPDGKTLAYCANRNGDYDVYCISVEGGEEVQLTKSPGLDDGPEYGADGKIYFNSVRDGLMNCYRMDANGENVTRLTDNGLNCWFPHIAPDMSVIAYIAYDPAEVAADDHPANKNVTLRLCDPDGGNDREAVKLFGGQGTINVNSWKPDSSGFAFVRYEL